MAIFKLIVNEKLVLAFDSLNATMRFCMKIGKLVSG